MFDRKLKSNWEKEDIEYMLECLYDVLMSVPLQGSSSFN